VNVSPGYASLSASNAFAGTANRFANNLEISSGGAFPPTPTLRLRNTTSTTAQQVLGELEFYGNTSTSPVTYSYIDSFRTNRIVGSQAATLGFYTMVDGTMTNILNLQEVISANRNLNMNNNNIIGLTTLTMQDTSRIDLFGRKTGTAATGGILTIQAWAQDGTGTMVEYGRQTVQATNVTDGSESAVYSYRVLRNGAYTDGAFVINANNGGVAIRNTDRLYLDNGVYSVHLATNGGTEVNMTATALNLLSSSVPSLNLTNTGTGAAGAVTFRDTPSSGLRQLGFANMFAVGGDASTDPSIHFTVNTGIGSNVSTVFEIAYGVGNQSSLPNIVLGNNIEMAATATSGFLYIKRILGNPTGTPVEYSTRAPIVISDASDRLYFYDEVGNSWRYFSSSGGFEFPRLGDKPPVLHTEPGQLYNPKYDRYDETICPLCKDNMRPGQSIALVGDCYMPDGALHNYAAHLRCLLQREDLLDGTGKISHGV